MAMVKRMKKRFNVFLSYNDSDLALIDRITKILSRIGIVAYSYRHFPEAGEYIPEIIKKNINDSEHFAVLLTEAGFESPWVNQEIGMAFALNLLIIPIVQKGVETKGFVELRQRIDYDPNHPEDAIKDLIFRLRYLCNAMTLQLTCVNENYRSEFSINLPTEVQIGEAIEKNGIFSQACPKCKTNVSFSPKTFEHLKVT